MSEELVLLPVGDIWNRPMARILGRERGLSDLVARNGRFLVTKSRAARVFSGQGQPRRYAGIGYEVWEITDPDFERDESTQQVVKARRRVEFSRND